MTKSSARRVPKVLGLMRSRFSRTCQDNPVSSVPRHFSNTTADTSLQHVQAEKTEVLRWWLLFSDVKGVSLELFLEQGPIMKWGRYALLRQPVERIKKILSADKTSAPPAGQCSTRSQQWWLKLPPPHCCWTYCVGRDPGFVLCEISKCEKLRTVFMTFLQDRWSLGFVHILVAPRLLKLAKFLLEELWLLLSRSQAWVYTRLLLRTH